MLTNRPCCALALFASLALHACQAPSPVQGTDLEGSLSVAGAQRHYRLHVPDSVEGRGARPLVIVLHGGGGTGKGLAKGLGIGFKQVAQREGLLLAYPDGIEKQWNDGRSDSSHRVHEENDVGFLRALVEHLAVRHPVDRARVYVAGISNGGMMTLRLACEAGDLFAATAALTASLPEAFAPACRPGRPTPVMIMNGTADPLVPFEGGEIRFGRRKLGRVWPTPATVDFWAQRNGCPALPRRRQLPDLDPDDGTRVIQEVYGPCRGNSEVVLFTIQGGGHAWPGAPGNLARWLVGRTSRDVNATEEIWRFFSRHRL